jgi:hypothetical protein
MTYKVENNMEPNREIACLREFRKVSAEKVEHGPWELLSEMDEPSVYERMKELGKPYQSMDDVPVGSVGWVYMNRSDRPKTLQIFIDASER